MGVVNRKKDTQLPNELHVMPQNFVAGMVIT